MSAIARLKEHPTGFWFIFWGELAERASFYGMRTVLAPTEQAAKLSAAGQLFASAHLWSALAAQQEAIYLRVAAPSASC